MSAHVMYRPRLVRGDYPITAEQLRAWIDAQPADSHPCEAWRQQHGGELCCCPLETAVQQICEMPWGSFNQGEGFWWRTNGVKNIRNPRWVKKFVAEIDKLWRPLASLTPADLRAALDAAEGAA